MDTLSILKRHLGSNQELFHTVYTHSRHVMLKALSLSERHPELALDNTFIEEAALLHDIGVYCTNAPDIHCFGSFPYIGHGYLGRELLEKEGLPRHSLVCERHTGTGLYLTEILAKNLPLPHRDLAPVSLEEQMICFADKFYSKSHLDSEFSVEEVRQKLTKYGPEGVARFDRWCKMFL
ncbi:MAG TPA: HD domain-containing protein [Bacteroidales bacterium]|nr:HD domain-containing protein [Bacteroidales bacterium]